MLNFKSPSSVEEAIAIQKSLAASIISEGRIERPRFIAGADVSITGDEGTAAIVVLSYPELEPVFYSVASDKIGFPYIPGLLSFREIPLVLAAWEKLTHTPDLLFVDGQGMAHPRHFGIACHLGLLLDIPTIGCAKSHLYGCYEEPGQGCGAFSWLKDEDKTIGAVLRTKAGSSPLFVSVGHKINLDEAVRWTVSCCDGHRLPKPARLAHLASKGKLNDSWC